MKRKWSHNQTTKDSLIQQNFALLEFSIYFDYLTYIYELSAPSNKPHSVFIEDIHSEHSSNLHLCRRTRQTYPHLARSEDLREVNGKVNLSELFLLLMALRRNEHRYLRPRFYEMLPIIRQLHWRNFGRLTLQLIPITSSYFAIAVLCVFTPIECAPFPALVQPLYPQNHRPLLFGQDKVLYC